MRVISTGVRYTPVKAALQYICLPLLVLLVLALFTGLFFDKYCNAYNRYDSSTSDDAFTCRADGVPVAGSSTDQCWDPSLFLSLTLAGGHLTFSQAKAIDISWDLVVGRGGQLLLAFLAYPVLRKSLTTAMERKPRRLSMIASLTFDKFCLWSMWEIMKDMHRRWSWRLLGYLWIIMYLSAFGTIVSAMTGYQANMEPYYTGNDSSLIPASTLKTEYIFQLEGQGERIGLDANANITDVDSPSYKALYAYYTILSANCTNPYRSPDSANGTLHDDHDPPLVSIDWYRQNITSSYSGSYNPSYPYANGYDPRLRTNCTTSSINMGDKVYNLTEPRLSLYRTEWKLMPNKTMLDLTWFKANSQCQVQKDYQWGFSSLLLFTFCIASILYASVLAALNIDIWYSSQINQDKQDFHLYRDILDFAAQIRDNLEDEKQANDMPANDLAKAVDGSAESSGVSVSAYDYPSSRAQSWKPHLSRMGTELKANHTYSWQETKRVWGRTYGPIPKPGSTFDRNVEV